MDFKDVLFSLANGNNYLSNLHFVNQSNTYYELMKQSRQLTKNTAHPWTDTSL